MLVVLAAYWPAINAGYVWDDDVFLTANPLIRADDGLQRFWFTTQAPDYFPLTSSVLWLEWRAWGDNPLPYHLVNILLHAAGAILLWRVLAAARLPGAYLAGLIFAVHPVVAGSVAWITELKNTLPMAVWLSSVLAYLHFDRRGRRGGYILALGLLAAAGWTPSEAHKKPRPLSGPRSHLRRKCCELTYARRRRSRMPMPLRANRDRVAGSGT